MIQDGMFRLEADPHQQDPERGWAAELADPVWLLGRQWQMGEHQGEDASSPVTAEMTLSRRAIAPLAGQPDLDPRSIPAEAIVESEPGDWWTAGRRIRIGRRVAAAAAQAGALLPPDPRFLLDQLPVPYDVLDGADFDGRALWLEHDDFGIPEQWFGPALPPAAEPVDLWDPAEFSYSAQFTAGDTRLVVDRHDGGNLDWFSADAHDAAVPGGDTVTSATLPGRLRFPSAPLPRWWQIEDDQVVVGGHAPDRAGLARLILLDLILNQSDDWFTITMPAHTGEIVTVQDAAAIDAFGQRWPLTTPTDWSLFATTGLDPRCLTMWTTAATPLTGPVLDEVVLGYDEDANLMWAVEKIIGGRSCATPEPPAPAADGEGGFMYRAMTPIPAHWHPYVVDDRAGHRRFIQGRAADLSGPELVLLDPPTSDLLRDPAAGTKDPVHRIEPAAVPQDGLRIERLAILARDTTGNPVLWTQRRRAPLLTAPAFAVRFDILEPDSATPDVQ
ncbi:hypothetical protein OG426_09860 [Streptomyces canus]|uniref:hypothetical protein n=1 Tax=Streptomyces canus TaxID=58343 RepID=UPI00386682F9|nr:hypothetical protein OG426_09860 [Streptomyces canus]